MTTKMELYVGQQTQAHTSSSTHVRRNKAQTQ